MEASDISRRALLLLASGATAATIAASALVTPFESDQSVGYRDPVGIPTAGVGHTGPDVRVGQFYDKQTREGWLGEDISSAEAVVDRCAPSGLPVLVKASFVSFAFNVGAGRKGVKDGFCILKSGNKPTFLRKAFSGDLAGSCTGLLPWNKAGGIVLPGLTRRRQAESAVCLEGVKNGIH